MDPQRQKAMQFSFVQGYLSRFYRSVALALGGFTISELFINILFLNPDLMEDGLL